MGADMAQVAGEILALAREEEPILARVVEMKGFGGRTSGEIAAISAGGSVGSLMFGSLQPALGAMAERLRAGAGAAAVGSIDIGDSEAVEAGLACGGTARVALVRVDPMMREVLAEISKRMVVGLATLLEPEPALVGYRRTGGEMVRGAARVDGALLGEVEDTLAEMVRARRAESRLIQARGFAVHLEVFSPLTRAVVVGSSELATAIVSQFDLLGVTCSVCDTFDDARRLTQEFGSNDALILLSHDHEIGVPLIAALAQVPGIYIGALGSRHTQETRRQLLLESGVNEAFVAAIHGPVGLDLGSRTPAETAVAIASEFLAHRSGRSPVPLRATTGSING